MTKKKRTTKSKASRVPKNLGGRPTVYRKAYADMVYELCMLKPGIIDEDIAKFFHVSEATINNWKKRHPKFLESISRGKEGADMKAAVKLWERAVGYSHPDVHISNYQGNITITNLIKHYAPDYNCLRLWLMNRAGWKDKIDQVHSGSIELKAPIIT